MVSLLQHGVILYLVYAQWSDTLESRLCCCLLVFVKY